MTHVLLHGFWGQPSDWNAVLRRLPLSAQVLTPDLYEDGPLSPKHSFKLWSDNLVRWIDKNVGDGPVALTGYSMGARLALHAAALHPHRFERVLLLSARPYLAEAEKPARRNWEQNWAEKFMIQPWSELENGWEANEVFAGSKALTRRRGDEASREMLALSLTRWSVCDHLVNESAVLELGPQVHYAYGTLDQKYEPVMKALQQVPVKGQIIQISGAGHRLPIDGADSVAHWIEHGRFT